MKLIDAIVPCEDMNILFKKKYLLKKRSKGFVYDIKLQYHLFELGECEMALDTFADIALKGIGGRQELLCNPVPKKLNTKICLLENKKFVPIKTEKKIDTKEELAAELAKIREKYAPFLENFAPKIDEISKRCYIEEFVLNGNENITIPHYGGPLGYSKQVYESDFVIDEINSAKAVYICFLGADYKAVVYVNNTCVGIHEGFFSPFEFNIDENIVKGKNGLKVELYNDYIYLGNAFATQEKIEGDKMYAATGLGYDDPERGWHHCPPGMGIYNSVFVEERNRVSISDIFVRTIIEKDMLEVWIEVENSDYCSKNIEFNISIYGQNFSETILENYKYIPETMKTVGMGDSLTEASVKDILGKGIPMPLKKGKNTYKIPVEMKNPKIWDLETPYLYQIQVEVLFENAVSDKKLAQFGMRSFTQDIESTPKGMFYLNDRKIRLRGANTMGFEQQDVLKGDINQLINDILLAKLCNMNFLRLTQRPVQDEIYEYCDKLGLMTQTDLPLFGCMRRTKLAEGVRQAEEMEKMVRKHPCNVIVSYINEPFPNANNEPHRHLTRIELESFFDACDIAVHLNNPDRVIKHVDGDYDPPSKTMPDNHCYPMWYNGHGIDIGMLHKGYWLSVKPDWYYGCGEYGSEGLDFAEVMQSEYPNEWLKEPFNPQNIINAQTGKFYYFFYDKGDDIYNWVYKSQEFQAFATKMMTEAFRRNKDMISNAIHLFIDAWPSGWMKTIMDCKRNPKPAYFAYKNAMEPIMLSLRTDRFTYFEGEKISVECFVCNDTQKVGKYKIVYELGNIKKGELYVEISACDVIYASSAEFVIDKVNDRESFLLKAIMLDETGKVITYTTQEIQVFEDCDVSQNENVELICNLEEGEYEIAGEKVIVKPCGMLPVHFVSRKTGHKAVTEFQEKDFSYWYDKQADMITPICEYTFTATGFTPMLISGNMNEHGEWDTVLACAEKDYQGKKYVICTANLRQENPIAKRFLKNIYIYD